MDIIEVKNIGKKYNITHQRGSYIALRDVFMNVLKAPFSFLKTKVRKAVGLETKEEFWALKNVSFSVKKGEVVGIIGANGAGKSTLLKILSQITPPTEGEIVLRGRVGSLLEVGTGFHPELTGRENVFLNGAILGMKKTEIEKKFDQIVEFAGIEKFLDTPVKFYSSGMYVRLAFSVAAHMEPDILIIDEVLAVGDAEFQKKCLGKMEEVTQKEGRTILFVSHNMEAIRHLCKKTVVLNKGQIKFIGETEEALQHYNKDISEQMRNNELLGRKRNKRSLMNVLFKKITFYDESKKETSMAFSGKALTIGMSYASKNKEPLENCRVSLTFKTISGEPLFACSTDLIITGAIKLDSEGEIKCHIDNVPLNKGKYILTTFFEVNGQIEDWIDDAAILEVGHGDFFGTNTTKSYLDGRGVLVKHNWIV